MGADLDIASCILEGAEYIKTYPTPIPPNPIPSSRHPLQSPKSLNTLSFSIPTAFPIAALLPPPSLLAPSPSHGKKNSSPLSLPQSYSISLSHPHTLSHPLPQLSSPAKLHPQIHIPKPLALQTLPLQIRLPKPVNATILSAILSTIPSTIPSPEPKAYQPTTSTTQTKPQAPRNLAVYQQRYQALDPPRSFCNADLVSGCRIEANSWRSGWGWEVGGGVGVRRFFIA